MKSEKNPINQMLDPNNTETILLYSDIGKPVEFEQIAVIPFNDKLYAIMRPLDYMSGVENGEGVLFEIDETQGDVSVIRDNEIIDEVLKIYKDLINDK